MVPENLIIRLTGSTLNYGASGTRGFTAGQESWEAPMAGFITTLITFAAGTAAAFGILLGAFLAISFAIRREDVTGTLTGHAPSRACRSARFLTQWHRIRWESEGPRPRLAIA
jgi:hypothetical protein